MHLAFSDWLIILLYFVASAAIGLAYTRKASQSLDEYFVSGRVAAVVARRHLDGRHDVRGRHAARRRRAGGQVRRRGQLALVERRDLGHPDRVLLRAALAPGRRAHRPRVRRAALRRQAGGGAARLPRALPRPPDQPDHHGLGHPGDGDDPADLAQHRSRGRPRSCCSASRRSTRSSPGSGASSSPTLPVRRRRWAASSCSPCSR